MDFEVVPIFFSIVNSVENHSYTSFFMQIYKVFMGFPGSSDGKESACTAGDPGSMPGLGRFSGEGNGKPTPMFLPGESHGQRSLVGYSPWGRKELDMTE